MQLALTLVSPDAAALKNAAARLGGDFTRLGAGALDKIVEGDLAARRAEALAAVENLPADVCVQLAQGRRKALFLADMDSTIINVECLDELADYAGLKDEIAAITERAMRGELEFEGALKERVGKLKGLGLDALQRAYDERVRLNPGAETLVKTMAANNTRCVLVSGGFTFFTGRVAQAAGFHANRANILLEDGSTLSGEVGMPILGKQAKLDALEHEAGELGIDLALSMAVGDGANDLAMIQAAGLGVAYRAKPVVAAQADVRLDHADLSALLYFQGYREEQFFTS